MSSSVAALSLVDTKWNTEALDCASLGASFAIIKPGPPRLKTFSIPSSGWDSLSGDH